MTNFATIQTAIYNAVDGIKTAAQIDAVYKYNPISLDGTPAVIIVPDTSGETILTTDQNELATNFIVRCMVENTSDQSTQVTRLLAVVDAVMAELRKDDNQTLGGNCHYFLVEEIKPIDYGKVESLEVMFMDLRISARLLKSITTP